MYIGRPLSGFNTNGSIKNKTSNFSYKNVFLLSNKSYKRFKTKKAAKEYLVAIAYELRKNAENYENEFPGGYYRLQVILDTMSIQPETALLKCL